MAPAMDQRFRSSKPITIHGFAQSGDLNGLQRLLKENPSLLNERNPVVCFLSLSLNSVVLLFS